MSVAISPRLETPWNMPVACGPVDIERPRQAARKASNPWARSPAIIPVRVSPIPPAGHCGISRAVYCKLSIGRRNDRPMAFEYEHHAVVSTELRCGFEPVALDVRYGAVTEPGHLAGMRREHERDLCLAQDGRIIGYRRYGVSIEHRWGRGHWAAVFLPGLRYPHLSKFPAPSPVPAFLSGNREFDRTRQEAGVFSRSFGDGKGHGLGQL